MDMPSSALADMKAAIENAEVEAAKQILPALAEQVDNAAAALRAYRSKDVSRASIAEVADQTWTGEAITPTPAVTIGSTTLVAGTDFDFSYSSNTAVGTATITVTGKGDFFYSKSATFNIVARSMTDATIAAIADQTATGEAIEPEPDVTWDGDTLVEGTDFEYSYGENTEVGEGAGSVTVTGKGNYSGTKTATFNIVADANENT